MSSAKRQTKKMKPADNRRENTCKQEKNEDLRGSEEDEIIIVEKPSKRRSPSDFDDDDTDVAELPVGTSFQSMLEKFGVDINKNMQAKKKRMESLTKNYMKESQNKLEQQWRTHQSQRQHLTQEYSQKVSAALQQLEAGTQRGEEQKEKMSNLFKQQIKVLQQARAAHGQRLKAVRELYELFERVTAEMQRSHDAFQKEAMLELKKDLQMLQRKMLMDIQQQEMANVRKSLSSMLF